MANQANETSQIKLLERDVKIQFDELRKLRTKLEKKEARIQELEKENRKLLIRAREDEKETKEDLSYYIKQQRLHLNMSRNELAKKLGIAQSTLSRYENGAGSLENMDEITGKIRKIIKERKAK